MHRGLILALLASCSSTFTPDNTRTFACAESRDDCQASGADPTCSTTFQDFHDDSCTDAPEQNEVATCGDRDIVRTGTRQEEQWTVFDHDSGELVAILEVPPTGATTCEVGPDDFDLGCDPATIQFFDDCPIPLGPPP